MNVRTISYRKKPDGSYERTESEEFVNPNDFKFHVVPPLNAMGIEVGMRTFENGEETTWNDPPTIIDPPPEATPCPPK